MTTEQYLIDQNQTELTTTVTSTSGLDVTFAATIIYPGGGGQPMDCATVTQGNATLAVTHATRTADTITYTLAQPLPTANIPVVQNVDAATRHRNMRYHTLLHLIAGTAANTWGCRVTSNQILADHARIELLFPTVAAKAAFNAADFTQTLQQAITAAHPVTARIVDRAAIAHESEKVRTLISLIPADVTQVRLVKIAGVDEEACAGTHVASTRDIGHGLTLTSKSKGPLKLRLKVVLDA
ncbi:alanyl-tRNA editing protein [Lacticaseibacillus sharpeae]|uniref:Threonine alanine tRNA ligase second additional domain protein n=1 Tax=Lacticaseibacillus sharpeae JCM 1186 = DSM 20505 TaxID=1291052 RepID=A0A0R1ZM53_9LACO|nr:alanyl-tRNA editing protein [Lacticaseibacillus sharpeae]KRM55426.1 threonine alanine tRNA ligase second additional domain protein [Lacticaseibacillus sharpeae JCM 1186 = DSM 20505]